MKDTKLIFMDIDGTLTDGKIYMGENGEMFKAFDIKDGYAIANILPKYNIVPIIITGRQSGIVTNRCKELNIDFCFQNVHNKKEKLINIANSFSLFMNVNGKIPHTAYIGDDIPDLECMTIVEKAGCPSDSAEEIKKVADFISQKKGGEGAVREFIEWLCKSLVND